MPRPSHACMSRPCMTISCNIKSCTLRLSWRKSKLNFLNGPCATRLNTSRHCLAPVSSRYAWQLVCLKHINRFAVNSRSERRYFHCEASMSSTYSFWVEPKGDVANALQQEISYLADAYGGPTFPPHVTLVGGISGTEQHALSLATKVASKLQPYRIKFDKPDHGSIYHQCIYLLCSEDEATMNAGKLSKEVCGQKDSEYMPHLSLLYSDIDEHVRSQATDVTKQRQASDPRLKTPGFDVKSLHVYETDPQDKSCKTWKLVKEVPFAQ